MSLLRGFAFDRDLGSLFKFLNIRMNQGWNWNCFIAYGRTFFVITVLSQKNDEKNAHELMSKHNFLSLTSKRNLVPPKISPKLIKESRSFVSADLL